MTNRRKLIETKIPEGVIVTRKWLINTTSLDKHAVDNLVKSEHIRVLQKGVYTRGISQPSWQSIVYTIQFILNTDYLVGGFTALEMKGFAHYMSQSKKTIIHLYGNDKLPKWINNLSDNIIFVRHSRKELFSSMEQLHSEKYITGHFWKEEMSKLKISIPEKACLEMLNEVPNKISFEHANQLIQGMTSLSPRTIQKLLEECSSVKVKRLFLWFGQKHNYTWFSKLDQSKIDIGSGNRMIAKGGELDKKYKITVPKDFDNE